MRTCKECGDLKDIKDFYSNNKTCCKECHKKRVIIWKKDNPQKVKKYKANPDYKKRQAEYYREWYAKNGRKRTKRDRELVDLWQKLNPEKCKASALVKYAVKVGKIKKPKLCSECKLKRKLLGHHPDYRFPFKVDWLCYSCHKKLDN